MRGSETRRKKSRPSGSTTRLATPFTIKCLHCNGYIHRNKRHNAIKEIAVGKDYLGVKSYRFHIKCTECKKMMSILTDPKNGIYIVEDGCTRVDEVDEHEECDSKRSECDVLRNESKMKDEINELREQINKVNSSSLGFRNDFS